MRHAGEALQWAAPVLRGSQRVAVDALAQNVEAWHHVAPPACPLEGEVESGHGEEFGDPKASL